MKARRWLLGVAAAVSAVLLLSGCSGITTVLDTQRALENDGFGSVSVSPKPTSNSLSVSVKVSAAPTESDVVRAAAVVWQSFHERFDTLSISVGGSGPAVRQEFTFAQMTDRFGARNPDWNSSSVESGTRNVGFVVIGVVAAVLIVAVVIILLVQRANRRRRPPWGAGPAPGQWPGQRPGPGQWPGQWPGPPPPDYPPPPPPHPPRPPG
ncbi:MAG: hypothetical protein M0Z30_08595 [Actinomycetota bacterium]|nr:hypothetical protein [Actinomycetota bacterium]